MTQLDPVLIARSLLAAYVSDEAIAPITDTHPGVTVTDAISAVNYVLLALEIVDSRIRDWKITLADTIADNASSGGVVLGSTPVPLAQLSQSGLSSVPPRWDHLSIPLCGWRTRWALSAA